MLARPEERNNGDLPYHDKIIHDENGHFVMPPSDVRLSDALVVLILSAAIPGRQRGSRWPADFDSAGDIKPTRWPMGETVVLWAFGLPFLPVYAGYYVLTGSRWRHHLWLIDRKTRHESLPSRSLQFGQFFVPAPTTPSDNALHLEPAGGAGQMPV